MPADNKVQTYAATTCPAFSLSAIYSEIEAFCRNYRGLLVNPQLGNAGHSICTCCACIISKFGRCGIRSKFV